MSMAKVSIKPTKKKEPVKAGSSNNKHGGYPTSKLILITKKIKNK